MLFIKVVVILFVVVWVIISLKRYKPKIEIVESYNTIIVLLWYNKKDWFGSITRAYKILFEI
nr:MAG TPA: hypothetical protein [Bacteriophage sp.]